MVLSKFYSNALMASLNSRAGVYYEHATMSDSQEENRTTSRGSNTPQFTSVGIPVTITDAFESVNGREVRSAKSVRLTMRAAEMMRAG